MGSYRRNRYSFRFKVPKLGSILELVSRLHPVNKINFREYHENHLGILGQEVESLALFTLAQLYDPPLRFFTFEDFQITPTLEEFEHLMGTTMKNKLSFRGIEEFP